MPMRRSHAKSRNGCSQCKARRVKCDERLPTCTRCEKRGESCSFLETASNNSPGSNNHHTNDTCPRQLLELELMHQWVTSTSDSIRSKRHDPSTPQIHMPQEGLAHPYLLDIMFSFAALHLASQRPEQADEYIAAALQFQNRGMQNVAPSLQSPAQEELFAVFWFSALVGMVTAALTVVTREASGVTFTGMLIKLGQLWSGTRTIMDLAGSSHEALASMSRVTRAPTPDYTGIDLDLDTETQFSLVEKIIDSEHADRDASTSIYRESVRLCRKALKGWKAERVFDDIMAWAPLLGNEFAAALSSGNPVALLCTMCYGTVMFELDDVWWMRGAGRAVVDECSVVLREGKEEWKGVIGWARAKVGLGLEVRVGPIESHAVTPAASQAHTPMASHSHTPMSNGAREGVI